MVPVGTPDLLRLRRCSVSFPARPYGKAEMDARVIEGTRHHFCRSGTYSDFTRGIHELAPTLLVGPLGMAHPARVFLYFVYFLLGISLGAGAMQNSLTRDNLRCWPLWLILGAVIYLVNGMAGDLFPGLSRSSRTLVDAVTMSFCCALTILALLGVARSLFETNWETLDSLSDNAYGIYIIHYFFVSGPSTFYPGPIPPS